MGDMRAPLDMLYPEEEAEKKNLPDMVRRLQEVYHQGEACKKLCKPAETLHRTEDELFEAEDIALL